jgi:hypothetical protein
MPFYPPELTEVGECTFRVHQLFTQTFRRCGNRHCKMFERDWCRVAGVSENTIELLIFAGRIPTNDAQRLLETATLMEKRITDVAVGVVPPPVWEKVHPR